MSSRCPLVQALAGSKRTIRTMRREGTLSASDRGTGRQRKGLSSPNLTSRPAEGVGRRGSTYSALTLLQLPVSSEYQCRGVAGTSRRDAKIAKLKGSNTLNKGNLKSKVTLLWTASRSGLSNPQTVRICTGIHFWMAFQSGIHQPRWSDMESLRTHVLARGKLFSWTANQAFTVCSTSPLLLVFLLSFRTFL